MTGPLAATCRDGQIIVGYRYPNNGPVTVNMDSLPDSRLHSSQNGGGRSRRYFKETALHTPGELEYHLPFRILRAGREQYTADYPSFHGRVLTEHHLVYVEEGYGRFAWGDVRSVLSAGSLVVIGQGVPHDLVPLAADPMEITWVVLEGESFSHAMAQAGLPGTCPSVTIGAAAEPRAIFRELRHASAGSIWRAYALLWTLLGRVAEVTGNAGMGVAPPHVPSPRRVVDLPGRPAGAPPPVVRGSALMADDPAIARAIEVAHAHLHQPGLRSEDLARAAALGHTRFLERFRLATGLSPMRYLELSRMEEARRLLEEGRAVRQVAELVGFPDPLYFSRRFRSVHGVPPTTYRAIAYGARP